jgi:integrase
MRRGDQYYYNRRVPKEVQEYVDEVFIRLSLKTDSRKVAVKKCLEVNNELERYWLALQTSKMENKHEEYLQAVNLSRIIGSSYAPVERLKDEKLSNLVQRIEVAQSLPQDSPVVPSLLGTVKEPSVTISAALKIFWDISRNKTMKKSKKQVRKWKNPRKRAVRNAIQVIGDKPLKELTRDDLIRFRDWWIERIEKEDMSCATANKDLIHLKSIVDSVAEYKRLDVDTVRLFRKLTLSETASKRRKPFSPDFIQNTFLKSGTLDNLNRQARNILLALINTGARPSEITGLQKEDIFLDHEIPHIYIRPNSNRQLKTRYSERKIPLLGCSLEAFKACPNGFPRYVGKTDTYSGLIGQFFRDNDLLPSKRHTLYSLRHGFQDRLTRANVNDRMQAELMGHKFNRPLYGDGPTLEQKYECLTDISL